MGQHFQQGETIFGTDPAPARAELLETELCGLTHGDTPTRKRLWAGGQGSVHTSCAAGLSGQRARGQGFHYGQAVDAGAHCCGSPPVQYY